MSLKTKLYKEQFKEDSWPGLDSIGKKQKEIYRKHEPMHWATVVPYELGGEDPLWAIECFNSEVQKNHFHFITLGFSNVYYDESYAEDEINGFGFEITFRYAPVNGE